MLEFPLVPDKDYQSWYVETALHIKPVKRLAENPVLLKLKLPKRTESLAIVDESFVADGFGHEIAVDDDTGNRSVILSKRNVTGNDVLYYRAMIYQLDSPSVDDDSMPVKADTTYQKKNRPKLNRLSDDPLFIAIDSLLEEARNKSADPTTFVSKVYKLAHNTKDDRVQIIANDQEKLRSPPALVSFLLNAAGVPARVVHGTKLALQRRDAKLAEWTDFYLDKKWHAFDPETGEIGLSKRFLPWWYGQQGLAEIQGAVLDSFTISIKQNTDNALTRAIWKSGEIADTLLRFSFFNLPLSAQLTFKILLLVPIGGLVISFLRQIVGLKTFGTFMPVLIALAFRQMGFVSGCVFFAIIISFGLIIRSYFDRLQLLMVPRLASLLTIVVLLIGLITMVNHNLGNTVNISTSLFPIVILSMTIERMTLMWDQYGAKEAFSTAWNSFIVVGLCFLAISHPYVEYIVFAFPEILLIVLAINIMLGRYNGYKLMEYYRFRGLERQIRKNQPMP
jgi:hypothetical protein